MQPSLRSMLAVVGMFAGMVGLVLPVAAVSAVAGADGALQVVGARLGVHAEMTRFVLEIGGTVRYQAATLGDPYRVLVDLPDVVWPGGEAAKPGLGVIRSYHLQRLRPGVARLVLDTTGPVRIRSAVVIGPSDGHQTRLVLDVQPITSDVFRQEQEQEHGRGSGKGSRPGEAALPLVTQAGGAPARSQPVPPSRHETIAPRVSEETRPAAKGEAPVSSSAAESTAASGQSAAALVPAAQSPMTQSPVAQPPITIASARPVMMPTLIRGGAGDRAEPPADPSLVAEDEPAPQPPSPAPPAQLAALVTPSAVPAPAKSHRGTPTGKPMIALDPGHGGVDPGATGYNGVHEKDITLATAREVRRQIEATGRYRVMMTRDDDEFIPLRERVAKAREADAQLFISLHADSIVGSTIRGMSIYTLSDKASDHEAESLAAKENRSDAIGGIDLSNENDQVATILIDLAQRDTRNHSRHFAGLVLHEVGAIQKLLPKADRSAGFAVLTAPDVPSVLIEMGYLSSPEDAELLTQAEHRQRLAASLVHAIDGYFGWLGGGRRS